MQHDFHYLHTACRQHNDLVAASLYTAFIYKPLFKPENRVASLQSVLSFQNTKLLLTFSNQRTQESHQNLLVFALIRTRMNLEKTVGILARILEVLTKEQTYHVYLERIFILSLRNRNRNRNRIRIQISYVYSQYLKECCRSQA